MREREVIFRVCLGDAVVGILAQENEHHHLPGLILILPT